MQTTLRILGACGIALAFAACTDATTEPEYEGADVRLLTPEVAAQLDSRGMFPEQQIEPGYVNPRTRAKADSLARQYINQFASTMRPIWESERGASIDVASLRRCSPIRYSSSAYDFSLMAENRAWRQHLAGQFHMLFCGADGRPALRVQVPVEPPLPGAVLSGDLVNIQTFAVPIEKEATALIGPEEAVRLAAGRTGQRVAAVPEYVNERFLFGFPRWIVRLESPIRVRGIQTLQTDTIEVVVVGYYIGELSASFIPATLRPFGFTTPEARLDTFVVMLDGPIDVYTAKLGNPRWAEPFLKLTP